MGRVDTRHASPACQVRTRDNRIVAGTRSRGADSRIFSASPATICLIITRAAAFDLKIEVDMVTINAHRRDQCVYCGHQTCQIRTTTDMHGGVVSTLERITTHQQGTSCLGQKVRTCRWVSSHGRTPKTSSLSHIRTARDTRLRRLSSPLEFAAPADCRLQLPGNLIDGSYACFAVCMLARRRAGVRRTPTADRLEAEGDQRRRPLPAHTSMDCGVRQVTGKVASIRFLMKKALSARSIETNVCMIRSLSRFCGQPAVHV